MNNIQFFHRDKCKLTNTEQLMFLDYLGQCLKNGFSLNLSLKLIPTLWKEKENFLQNLNLQIENGVSLGAILVKLGFSKQVAAQLNMAFIEGSLPECLAQLTELLRLKNKQIKKLQSELTYPILLVGMMIFLLIGIQTFLKTEINSSDLGENIIFTGLLTIIFLGCGIGSRIIYLLHRQDYASFNKLKKLPFLGSTLVLYIQYLLVYDIGILIADGFSLQQICKFTQKQEEGSVQKCIGLKVQNQLSQGKSLENIIKEEEFLPNSLLMLITSGGKRDEMSRKAVLLSKTLFYELNLKLTKLVVNIQPICFIFIGICILGMYLKILMPMYSVLQTI